jgi:hypothetical protein
MTTATTSRPGRALPVSRSVVRAGRMQDRLDRLVLVAAVVAIVGVALQTIVSSGPGHDIGLACAALSWLAFVVDVGAMLAVSPRPNGWLATHRLELALLVFTCPLWPVLFYNLLWLELLPALTVLQAAKLAKLIKVGLAVCGRRGAPARVRPVVAAVVLTAAVVVGGAVIVH